MKDIVMIGDYSNTPEKKELLLDLVDFFKKNNKEVMITSHVVPEQIVMRKCDYFIYDKENKILTEKKHIGYSLFRSDLIDLHSKLPARQNTFLAVMKLMFNGFALAKNLKYDVVHYVEYDSKINDISEFDKNLYIMRNSNYGGVGYFVNDWMSGNYICFNMNHLDHSEIIYDEEKLLQNIDLLCETFLYTRFLKDNLYRKEFDLINNQNFQTGLCSGDFLYWAVVFIHQDEFYVFCFNHNKDQDILFNIISDGKATNLWLRPKNFNVFKLEKDTQYVKIYGNDRLYLDVDLFKKEDLDFLTDNTTVSKFNN